MSRKKDKKKRVSTKTAPTFIIVINIKAFIILKDV